VQAGLRSLKPPVGEGKLLLGFDDSGLLAAVALVRFVGSAGDTYLVKLATVAVDRRCQRRGYGVEAIEMALRAAADEGFGRGHHLVTVVGWVDPSNSASRIMNTRAGLRLLGMNAAGDYEEWGIELELPAESWSWS
jgi:GNAT superfamily N-acetyltransferase